MVCGSNLCFTSWTGASVGTVVAGAGAFFFVRLGFVEESSTSSCCCCSCCSAASVAVGEIPDSVVCCTDVGVVVVFPVGLLVAKLYFITRLFRREFGFVCILECLVSSSDLENRFVQPGNVQA